MTDTIDETTTAVMERAPGRALAGKIATEDLADELMARADADGQFRLADNLRRVQDSLDRIIPALEALGDDKQS